MRAATATASSRYARGLHGPACLDLVAHAADDLRIGADEGDMPLPADFRQQRVFGEEAVPRVQGVAAGGDGEIHDAMGVQVTGDRLGPDVVGLVGLAHMQRVAVGVCVNRHRGDPCLGAGTDDSHGDLATVGDEDFSDHVRYRVWWAGQTCGLGGLRQS